MYIDFWFILFVDEALNYAKMKSKDHIVKKWMGKCMYKRNGKNKAETDWKKWKEKIKRNNEWKKWRGKWSGEMNRRNEGKK